jgi:hypothetical protein
MDWYKRDPAKALNGMQELSLEERGAYNTILDLIYSKFGEIDDDSAFICRWLCCDVRVWKRLRNSLIEKKKIYIIDGKIRNSKADLVITSSGLRAKLRPTSAASTRLSAEQVPPKLPPKSHLDLFENKHLAEKNDKKTQDRYKSKDIRDKKEPPISPKGDFESWYSIYPHKVGKAAAKKSYESAIKKSSEEDLIQGVKNYIRSKPPDRPYCNPSTWLNQERWLDQPQEITQTKGNGNGKYTSDDALREIFAEIEARETDSGDGPAMLCDPRHLRKEPAGFIVFDEGDD